MHLVSGRTQVSWFLLCCPFTFIICHYGQKFPKMQLVIHEENLLTFFTSSDIYDLYNFFKVKTYRIPCVYVTTKFRFYRTWRSNWRSLVWDFQLEANGNRTDSCIQVLFGCIRDWLTDFMRLLRVELGVVCQGSCGGGEAFTIHWIEHGLGVREVQIQSYFTYLRYNFLICKITLDFSFRLYIRLS